MSGSEGLTSSVVLRAMDELKDRPMSFLLMLAYGVSLLVLFFRFNALQLEMQTRINVLKSDVQVQVDSLKTEIRGVQNQLRLDHLDTRLNSVRKELFDLTQVMEKELKAGHEVPDLYKSRINSLTGEEATLSTQYNIALGDLK